MKKTFQTHVLLLILLIFGMAGIILITTMTDMTGIAFAVGGGGGGGGGSGGSGGSGSGSSGSSSSGDGSGGNSFVAPTIDVMTLATNYSCQFGKLEITLTGPKGKIVGGNIKIYRNFKKVAEGNTGITGTYKAELTEGKYKIEASANDYYDSLEYVTINKCDIESEETFECEQLPKRSERLKCQIKLDDELVKKVKFLPEECRELKATEKRECVEKYRLLQTCRLDIESSVARTACIKPKLGLGQNVSEARHKCSELTNQTEKQTCMKKVTESILSLVKFRMYDLEYKARELMEKGVSEDATVTMITKIEDAKEKFNKATDNEERKAVIKELQQEWRKFASMAKAIIGNLRA